MMDGCQIEGRRHSQRLLLCGQLPTGGHRPLIFAESDALNAAQPHAWHVIPETKND